LKYLRLGCKKKLKHAGPVLIQLQPELAFLDTLSALMSALPGRHQVVAWLVGDMTGVQGKRNASRPVRQG